MWNVAENHYTVIAVACNDVLRNPHNGDDQALSVDEQRKDLQRSLLKQRDSGLLLCLCSNNATEEDVWAAFDSNPDMPLQRDDFVATAIGPHSSVESLRRLAAELGLGLDGFIFVSSDSAECSEVETMCPEVMTLQAPPDAAEIPAWLKHVWVFDRNRIFT
jgi:FkbH-like protein